MRQGMQLTGIGIIMALAVSFGFNPIEACLDSLYSGRRKERVA